MQTATITPQTFAPPVLTEQDVVKKLLGYALERQTALRAYPGNYLTGEKLKAVLEIIDMLDQAAACSTSRGCIRMVLKTSINFHFIAPGSDRKKFVAWYTKIESVMQSCREYLGWRAQHV